MAKIALDIDSTLHHYWDVFDSIAKRRFGVELPYEEQTDWGIALLERDQLIECVEETHSVENIMGRSPTRTLSRPCRAGTTRATGST
ncbi:MAG: hypothetical protein ACJ76V_13165 [Thermoleophilaceae bacterium]